MSVHAKYAPSGAKRLLNCPGSFKRCEPLPEPSASKWALEGSAAHLLGERCLLSDMDATDKIGMELVYRDEDAGEEWKGPVTEEMALAVQVYLDEIRRKRKKYPKGECLVEERLHLSWISEDLFGTGDHVLIHMLDRVCVDDYKHGAGVAVEVEDNPQLMIYGLGGIGRDNLNMVDTVELTITQPRAPHPEGPIRKWEIKADTLIEWGNDVLIPGLRKAQEPNAPLVAGEWCRWCKALSTCPAMRKEVQMSVETMFDNELLPVDPGAALPSTLMLTAEQLDRLIKFAPIFSKWLESMQAEGLSRLEAGAPDAPREWKLVAGKASRAWKDEAEIAAFIKDKEGVKGYSEPKIKSPAQMETAFKLMKLDVKTLAGYIEKKPGRPKMVPLKDKRAALPPKVETMFGVGEFDPFA